MKILSVLAILLSLQSLSHAQAPQLGKNSVKEVVAAMTTEEKARLVVGMGFKMPGMPPAKPKKDDNAKKQNGDPTAEVLGLQLPQSDPEGDIVPEKVPGAAGRTHAIPRLGIPSITVSDGPAGLRIDPIRNGDSSHTYYATAFPVATLLASTWDTAIVRKVGVAFGEEIHDYGVDVILGPGLNIHRNPRGGRNFEYYSEDPIVTGHITAAIVNGIQSQGVGTSIKHFAANNQETNRNSINTIVSERAMREIYLKGFQIAVKESNPWTVMSSYNKINGTYTSESRDLLTHILKDEWKYKGFVMTDWFGGKDPVAQMNAGNDLLMPGNPGQSKAILDAVQSGKITQAQLDYNVERMLHIILKSPSFKNDAHSDKPNLAQHAAVARMAASEGMILLKNNDAALPLKRGAKIAAYGNTAYDIIAGGTGSGDVNKAYTISLIQGLENAGFSVDESLKNKYIQYIADAKAKRGKPRFFFELPTPIDEMPTESNMIQQEAKDADVAVITIGRNAGEGADRKLENDYYITAKERTLIENVVDAFHAKGKKVVIVLNIGGVMEVATWRDVTDAIVCAWQPGLEAGNAIADILSGKTNPSGKLATSFPFDYNSVPSAKNFPGIEFPMEGNKPVNPMQGRPSEVTYEEGIYVGYRYYNSFHIPTAYEFGYGLSYSTFSFSDVQLSAPNFDQKMTATLSVKNTGSVAGKEVVQLYLTAPAHKMDKPAQELKAFAKTNLLQPGESQTITFTLNAHDLSSFDTKNSHWVADAGKYTVKIGASSSDIKTTATFTLATDIVTEKVSKALAPSVSIMEMKQ